MSIPFGVMIGRYQVANDIARGGFGTVFLARAKGPLHFSRWVALKVAHKHVAGEPNARELFIHEVQITSALVHSNLCTPFDSGSSQDDGLFLAMDYLRGLTFVDLAKRFRSWTSHAQDIGVNFVARLVADAARGLHAAHEAKNSIGESLQIIHRDVALSNLMLCFDGQVKVIDFGVARSTQQVHATGIGVLRGHLSYLSPEQIGGDTFIDRRIDVWGLGVVLWELLAGRKCFVAETTSELMKAIFHRDAPSLRLVAPHVPEALVRITESAMQRDRNRRTATAGEVCEALESFLRKRSNAMSAFEVARLLSLIAPGAEEAEEERLRQTALKLNERTIGSDQNVFGKESITLRRPPLPTTPQAPDTKVLSRKKSVMPTLFPRQRRMYLAAVALFLCGGAVIAAVFMAPRTAVINRPVPAANMEPSQSIRITQLQVPAPSAAALEAPASPERGAQHQVRQASTAPSRHIPSGKGTIAGLPGTLNVATRGGFAEVYLDGKALGESPVALRLAQGSHQATAVFETGQVIRKTVFIQGGGHAYLILIPRPAQSSNQKRR